MLIRLSKIKLKIRLVITHFGSQERDKKVHYSYRNHRVITTVIIKSNKTKIYSSALLLNVILSLTKS